MDNRQRLSFLPFTLVMIYHQGSYDKVKHLH